MPAHFEHLPNEMLGAILKEMDWSEMCNLRLTCKTFAHRVAQSDFKDRYRCKHVHISTSDLEDLVFMTEPGRLGTCIGSLHLSGLVFNSWRWEEEIYDISTEFELLCESEDKRASKKIQMQEAQNHLEVFRQRQADFVRLHKARRDVQLLHQAFRNLAAAGGKPISLYLEVVAYDGRETQCDTADDEAGPWRSIWKCARQTFHAIFQALPGTNLQVDHLRIFELQQRCSLACNELSEIDWESLRPEIGSLKHLFVSLSSRVINVYEEDASLMSDDCEMPSWHDFRAPRQRRPIRDVYEDVYASKNNTGLARLLRICGELKELDLHYYRLPRFAKDQGWSWNETAQRGLIRHVVADEMSPKALTCYVRGFYVREHDLLAFVKGSRARVLYLKNITLLSGSFKSIFDYCRTEEADLETLHFSNLREKRAMAESENENWDDDKNENGDDNKNENENENRSEIEDGDEAVWLRRIGFEYEHEHADDAEYDLFREIRFIITDGRGRGDMELWRGGWKGCDDVRDEIVYRVPGAGEPRPYPGMNDGRMYQMREYGPPGLESSHFI